MTNLHPFRHQFQNPEARSRMAQKETYHPLVHVINQFAKKRRLFEVGSKIVVGVSGGVDSMVLLDYLSAIRRQYRLQITVAHVNHRLRGKESDADERFVQRSATRYGYAFRSKRFDTKRIVQQEHGSLQQTARDLRYSFFDSIARSVGADRIVTAHHADDNAETMLFNFIRGTGIDGMSGIPPKRGSIVRPLLCVTRRQIEEYAKERGIDFRTDASNTTDDYSRNFLRNRIIPSLRRRLNPSLTAVLTMEAELFRAAADFAEQETDRVYDKVVSDSSIVLKRWRSIHPFLQQSVIRRLFKELGIEPTSTGIVSVAALAEQQKGTITELTGTHVAERSADRIILRAAMGSEPFRYRIDSEGTFTLGTFVLTVKKRRKPARWGNNRSADASMEYVDADRIVFPLIVRSWSPGDRFIPLGMSGRKKLSDFFAEQKMTATEKQETPIVESGGAIVWVGGRRLDDRWKVTPHTTSIYQLTLRTHGKKNDHRQ